MSDDNHSIHRFHGRRPFSLDEEFILDFLDIREGMRILDLGGADGYYSKKFLSRGASVVLLDAHDYGFGELNKLGIGTVIADFCNYDIERFDMVFMAHIYHDLAHICRDRSLENLSKISMRYIANLDFVKEETSFGPPVSMRLDPDQVTEDMKFIDFRLKKEKNLPFHYLQLFEREKD